LTSSAVVHGREDVKPVITDIPPLAGADAPAPSQNRITARVNRLLLMGSANTPSGSGHRRIRAAVSSGHQAPLTLALLDPAGRTGMMGWAG